MVYNNRSNFEQTTDLLQIDKSLLLESIPTAALVYHRSEDKMLLANKKFFELLGMRYGSLADQAISQIIPGELDTNPTGKNSRPVRLRLNSGNLILSSLQIFPLSKDNQVVVLVFSPPDKERSTRQEQIQREDIYDNLSLLTLLGKQQSQDEVFEKAAMILEKTISPKFLLLYLPCPDGKSFCLERIPGRQFLPEYPPKVPASELEQFSSVHLWTSARKPPSAIHAHALAEEESVLICLPFEDSSKLLGMLLAVGVEPMPSEQTLRYLNLFCAHTATALKQCAASAETRRKLGRLKHINRVSQTITDNLEEGVIILTPELLVAEMNPSAEIMFGYASKEVFRQKAENVLVGSDSLHALYLSAQQGISTLGGRPISLNTRNGKSFLGQIFCIPIKFEGRLTGIVLIIRDLSQTEQIRAKSQQLEQRALLGEVAAVFAHEVRNPINSVMTGLQLMGMGMKAEDPNYALTHRLQNDCLRLTHLMESTLSFSKPIEYHLEAVNIAGLLHSILERWSPRLVRLNIKANFESVPEEPFVEGDLLRLEQVFVNLLSNAIQAMEDSGGILSVRIHPLEKEQSPVQYEIIVADSGPGIPEEMRAHIFEPFVTSKSSGTGLGLAISKRIISAHKGNISVESFPGGTLFHVLLPKAEKVS
ncbi:MAG: ATP-binding protein [Anaerolineaceae bacterium]|nr:ATP-binding protein [Anaerolineaceae bacterium]